MKNHSTSNKVQSTKEENFSDHLLIDFSMTMSAYRLNRSYTTNDFHCIYSSIQLHFLRSNCNSTQVQFSESNCNGTQVQFSKSNCNCNRVMFWSCNDTFT